LWSYNNVEKLRFTIGPYIRHPCVVFVVNCCGDEVVLVVNCCGDEVVLVVNCCDDEVVLVVNCCGDEVVLVVNCCGEKETLKKVFIKTMLWKNMKNIFE
jgi:hypothetical protein